MKYEVLFSSEQPEISWSESENFAEQFGTKAAGLLALPRSWSPPYMLISAKSSALIANPKEIRKVLNTELIKKIVGIAKPQNEIIIRSSVIGETIWDRGKYLSKSIIFHGVASIDKLQSAVEEVLLSAKNKNCALIIQRYVAPIARGEFGNLLRISKTRDQWELSNEKDGKVSKSRFNSQRDVAAEPNRPLGHQRGLAQERLLGSVAAWLNNELLLGRSTRVNCEWIATSDVTYVVQLDEETEDVSGRNPFQLRIGTIHEPLGGASKFVLPPDSKAISTWDKLQVLDDLTEPRDSIKPKLFFIPFESLDNKARPTVLKELECDLKSKIGPDGIVVRTSVRSGNEKLMNLPRSEGLKPKEAALWIFDTFGRLKQSGHKSGDLAFIIHRFIAARASVWARSDPSSPTVELHCLWGLPDALQYCPYDIWEVHLPTETATEYPEYKSNMLVANGNGKWNYERVKNELGRSLCVSRPEALDIAHRTAAIAKRLNKPIHVMWFIGCQNEDGTEFHLPWYWVEAPEPEKNNDRSSYEVLVVSKEADLQKLLKYSGSTQRMAVELMPTEQTLMRDEKFISAVGRRAQELGIPVILNGSTLAHAYYMLRREGCTVVARGEKERSRVRRVASFGKLVRDKIPSKISSRGEMEITQIVPEALKKGFLLAKLVEEVMEVRNASKDDKLLELADVYEVLSALFKSEGYELQAVQDAADSKRNKSGGFDKGLILMQTGILGREQRVLPSSARQPPQVLPRKTTADTLEIPFTIFGFLKIDQPRTVPFDQYGVQLTLTLKTDCIVIEIGQQMSQLDLDLNE